MRVNLTETERVHIETIAALPTQEERERYLQPILNRFRVYRRQELAQLDPRSWRHDPVYGPIQKIWDVLSTTNLLGWDPEVFRGRTTREITLLRDTIWS
jgi:hypothetical protein